MAQHKAGAPSILGLMVTRGSRWVIHSWLQRHVAMLELLAVLDGSPPGSRDARWTEHHCSLYSNVHYRLEQSENLTSPTDQTARDSATSILRRMGVALGAADGAVVGAAAAAPASGPPPEYIVPGATLTRPPGDTLPQKRPLGE